MSSALNKFETRVNAANSLLCVGLDSAIDRLPESFLAEEHPQFAFNRWIIEQTHAYVSAYKPNLAFYESRGAAGWHELALTMQYLHEHHPDIFTICDAKRGDIASSNEHYARAIFDELGFDAITLHPYTGREGLAPFLERADKVSIILARTSNPGAGDVQDLAVGGRPLWQTIVHKVAQEWNAHENCMLVVGATYPNELHAIRQIVGEMPLLIPGVGTQGGDLAAVLQSGQNAKGGGLSINVSRAVIFAQNPSHTAQTYRDAFNEHRING